MKQVTLAGYVGNSADGGLIDKLGTYSIRIGSMSRVSHVELIVDGKWYSSSIVDGGVRSKDIVPTPGHWIFYDIPDADGQAVIDYFTPRIGEPFGWLDLIMHHVLRIPDYDGKGEYCSEICRKALGIETRVMAPVDLFINYLGRRP